MHTHDNEIGVAVARKTHDFFVRAPLGDEFLSLAPRAGGVRHQSMQQRAGIVLSFPAIRNGLEFETAGDRPARRPVQDMD